MMTEENKTGDSTIDSTRDRSATSVDMVEPLRDGTAYLEDGEQSVVYTVINLLAETLDEDPKTMDPPLGAVIDPEILERLQRTDTQFEQTFTFTYRNCAVTATNHGVVSVRRNPPHGSS